MSGPVSADPPSDRQALVDKNGILTPYGHRLFTALWQRTGGFEDDIWRALGLGFTGLTQAGQLAQQVGDLADGQRGLEGAIAGVRGDPRLATADRAEDKADDALVTALSRAPAEVGRRIEELERTVAKLGAALGSTQAQLRQNVASQQTDFREAIVIAGFNAGLTAAQSQNALNQALEAAQEVQDQVDAITAGFDASVRAAVFATAPITFNSGTGFIGWSGDTDDVPEGANQYFTAERVDDRVSALLQSGSGLTWTYDDTAGTLTPAFTGNVAIGATHTAAELLSLLSTSDADIRVETQADGDFSALVFRRTRASVAAVQSGDSTGSIQFWGYDGTSYIRTAQILSQVAGGPGTNDMPGNLTFWTTPDGSATLTQRVTIHPDGTLEALAGLKAALPTYADNAAAVTGGLATNSLYQTATGAVRTVV